MIHLFKFMPGACRTRGTRQVTVYPHQITCPKCKRGWNDVVASTDFTVKDEGTVIIFTALSDEAKNMRNETLGLEGWQMWPGDKFVIDHRTAIALIEQLQGEGLTVRDEDFNAIKIG